MREVQFGVYRGASGFVQEEVSWDWVGIRPLALAGAGLLTRGASPAFLPGLFPHSSLPSITHNPSLTSILFRGEWQPP